MLKIYRAEKLKCSWTLEAWQSQLVAPSAYFFATEPPFVWIFTLTWFRKKKIEEDNYARSQNPWL